MKVTTTDEELQGLNAATTRGAIEGALAGLAVSVPASFAMHRYWPAYRQLPIQLKVLGIIIVTAPAYAIQAERRTTQFDEEHNWKGATREILERERSKDDRMLEGLTGIQRIRQWAIQNQYKVILGSWAASMTLASVIIFRDRHQTTSQKIVQARMWAQGLTIGILIGAGILTHSQRLENAKHHNEDHSWRDLLEAEERARRVPPIQIDVTKQ
ncbi:hypothetical protein K488DRAFT_67952 [Vararia minispora EC-137]|uniref:Uncharacterized protein n=1 Tax=Vararia minispora EC-137 TaxID=1314806 RepID=A0ACB8QWN2_9AGAM|nr:hypothetical protein K488DRAFT_67952 [Vararia minispora EC-137]